MTATIKKAAITTALVLLTIYALRQVSVTSGLVDRALRG
jgi:hypothetical protein